MSAIKRVQKLLLQAEKRSAQSAADQVSSRPKYSVSSTNDEITDIERVAAIMAEDKHDRDEIILKATGKAIAKALSLGVWFEEKGEYSVRIETGTVGAIDDIVAPEDGGAEDEDKDMKEGADEEIPESRIRYASTIQIFVSAAA
jgi:ribonuclease P/MRP protein subunit POP7